MKDWEMPEKIEKIEEVEKEETLLKHSQISRALYERIREGVILPGSRLPSEMALARQFCVSHLTVRQAKKTLMQQGVLYSVNRKGVYVTENALASRVGVFSRINFSVVEDAHFLRVVFESLEGVCRDRMVFRYYHELSVGEPTGPWANRLVERARAEHIEVALLAQEMPEVEIACHEQGVPVIVLGNESLGSSRIYFDPEQRVRLGMDYFSSRGITQIGLIGRRGNAMAEYYKVSYGSKGSRAPIQWLGTESPYNPQDGYCFEESGYRQFHHIWSCAKHPEGVLILDDVMLKGAAYAMMELGVRPGRDFELVSCYNKNSRLFVPVPFVHIEIDPASYARAAAKMLARVILNPGVRPSDVRIKSKIKEKSRHDS